MDGLSRISPKSSIGDILCELDKLTISDVHRNELEGCLNDILTIDVGRLRDKSNNNIPSIYENTAIALIKFAECTINALKVFKVISPQYVLLCNAIVNVVEHVCLNGVDSSVLKKFCPVQESDFQARCQATCGKISQCISYMQGLPKPGELDREQKHLHIQMLASDVPVQTGTDELLTLGVKIENILSSPDDGNFCQLMENVRLYCCMATFRELFLLYRFARQTAYGVDAAAITNVIIDQRSRDRNILTFLYRPTSNTAKFFCKYHSDEWPIVTSFVDRRGLQTEDLSDLGGGIFQIQSMYFKDKCLSAGKRRLTSADIIQCETNSDEKCTLFQLQGGKNNVFAIYPCVYDTPCHVRDSKFKQLEISACQPSTLGLWYIQKIYSDYPGGDPFYVIRLAADDKMCLHASKMTGMVYAKSTSSIGPQHFWRFKPAQDLYINMMADFDNLV